MSKVQMEIYNEVECQVVLHSLSILLYSQARYITHPHPDPKPLVRKDTQIKSMREKKIHRGSICGRSSAFLGIFTHSADGYGFVGA